MLLSNGQGHGPSGFLLHPFTGIFDHLSMGIFDPHGRCFVWVRAYVCLVNRWLWNSKKSQFLFSTRRIPEETFGHVLSWHYPHLLGLVVQLVAARLRFRWCRDASMKTATKQLSGCDLTALHWGSPPPSLEADAWFGVRGACGVGVSLRGIICSKGWHLGHNPPRSWQV